MRKDKYYGMKVHHGIFGDIIKYKEWDNAKCPICKKELGYEHSLNNVWFYCENIKCKAYLRRSGAFHKTIAGNIEVSK